MPFDRRKKGKSNSTPKGRERDKARTFESAFAEGAAGDENNKAYTKKRASFRAQKPIKDEPTVKPSALDAKAAEERRKNIFSRERKVLAPVEVAPRKTGKPAQRREKSNAETTRSRAEPREERPAQREWGSAPQTPFDEKPKRTERRERPAFRKREERSTDVKPRGRTEERPRIEKREEKPRFEKKKADDSEPVKKKKKRSGKPRMWDWKERKHTKPEAPKDPSAPQRVQKLIAAAGLTSRREAETWISEGRVQVNGQTIKLGDSATTKDKITVNGAPLQFPKPIYLMLHKPKGYVTTVEDKIYKQQTVMDLIAVQDRVYPVGRLDKDTTGVLLFTNDGEFANRIMHPRYEVKKTYVATLDKPFDSAHIAAAQKGLRLEEGIVRASIRVLAPRKVEVTLHQGYNHVVKRIMKMLGYWVKDLQRTRVGAVTLNIPVATYRPLTEQEIASFR
jgi:23S rRNA pseudouridine2605 synthase